MQVYKLEPGRGYGATFTLVYRIGSERVLLAVEYKYGWAVFQLNTMVAFFQETLENDVRVKTALERDERI